MSHPFIDTDVLIRLLTGDDLAKQEQATQLFEAVEAGTLTIEAPVTVLADAVYVLASPRLYHLPRPQVQVLLSSIVRLTGFRVPGRKAVLRAPGLYGSTNLDFGDCLIVASMEQRGSERLCSYDRDFDRFPGIRRHEPGAPASS
ncbi:MAG: PIN domain-containing protein [Chloroflexi bacterium]|nr:PIN domain-containing protein [Chloroflexota bacterium]